MRSAAIIAILSISVLAAVSSGSGSPAKIRLWSGDAPGANGNRDADIPTLEINEPDPSDANGAAILMVPGGSYSSVVMSEADAAKRFWLPKGFVVAVLKYRVAPYKYPVPIYDVKRAMRILRSRADELGVVSSRIGILGCSAGGHLSSYLATHYDFGNPDTADTIEQQHCRPDFSIFVYPVITMDASFTHMGSRRNLLGNSPSASLIDSCSNEKQVIERTPPTFLVHGRVDDLVPVRNSQEFYNACAAHDVDAKFYRIESACGYHGLNYACENWADTCYEWLGEGGYLESPTRTSDNPRRSSVPVHPLTNDDDDYVQFNLLGTMVPRAGSHQAAMSGRSSGTFIVAKRINGRYIPLKKRVMVGNR